MRASDEHAGPCAAPTSLWAPARRGMTTGLVLTTTFIAAEALAVL